MTAQKTKEVLKDARVSVPASLVIALLVQFFASAPLASKGDLDNFSREITRSIVEMKDQMTQLTRGVDLMEPRVEDMEQEQEDADTERALLEVRVRALETQMAEFRARLDLERNYP